MGAAILFQLSTARQSVELLRQDKEFFAKQAGDLHSRLLYTEERLMAAHDGLDRAKQSREQLYDKYVASRFAHFLLYFFMKTCRGSNFSAFFTEFLTLLFLIMFALFILYYY